MTFLLVPLIALLLIILLMMPIFPEEKLLWIVTVFIAFMGVVISVERILPR